MTVTPALRARKEVPVVTLPAGATGSGGAGSGAGRDSPAASFIGAMVRRAAGAAFDAAGAAVPAAVLRRGPVTTPDFAAGLPDRAVDDEGDELDDLAEPVESDVPESA
jgi:hypothetical protein